MAQLVEQRIRNAWVAGSSPARGSFLLCEISTSVVHRLPKPVRRVRLPYLAQRIRCQESDCYMIFSTLIILF